MPDREASAAAGEATVGDEGALRGQAFRLQVAGRVEHFLHARAAFRAFVADHDDIAGLHLIAEDAGDGVVLAVEDAGRAGEDEERRVDTGSLDDGAVQSEVAGQHCEAAILAESVGTVAEDAFATVHVQRLIAVVLAERLRGADRSMRPGNAPSRIAAVSPGVA